MKKLSAEEVKDMLTLTNGRETAFSAAIKQLAVGEGLQLLKTEWKAKYPPSRIVKRVQENTNRQFTIGRLLDASGWLVVRLK